MWAFWRCRRPDPAAGVDRAVRDLAAAVPPPVGVPDRVDPVEGPVVTLAETDTVCRRLGTMLDAEHPLGAGLHVGRPLRYPVGSDPGWLGGCVVAAPALVLKPRDRWIGRDAAGREAHLDRVVGLARFLIRPGLACRNLASTAPMKTVFTRPACWSARRMTGVLPRRRPCSKRCVRHRYTGRSCLGAAGGAGPDGLRWQTLDLPIPKRRSSELTR